MNILHIAKRLAELEMELAKQQIKLAALTERVAELEPRKPGRPRKDHGTD